LRDVCFLIILHDITPVIDTSLLPSLLRNHTIKRGTMRSSKTFFCLGYHDHLLDQRLCHPVMRLIRRVNLLFASCRT
jgi:hypothetical protein